MITFTCQYCGRSTSVCDTLVGQKRRCSACGRILTVPNPQDEGIAAMAGALQAGKNARPAGQAPIPPPPQIAEPSLDDFEIAAPKKDPFSETDILPTDPFVEAMKSKTRVPKAPKPATSRPLPDRPARSSDPADGADRQRATMTAIAVMLFLIAVVFVLLLILRYS